MNCIVITFHSEPNYGAVLQAYALQEYLSKKNSVQILNIEMKKRSSLKEVLKNSFNIIKKVKFKKFLQKKLKLTKKVMSIEQAAEVLRNADYAIVGSDQVWAFDLIKGYERIFFLDMTLNKTKRVAYAASFGKDKTITENKEVVQGYLKNFDKISTREQTASNMLNDMNIPCEAVIDPTLLLQKEDYVQKFRLVKQNKRYILVYMLVIDEEVVKIANEISKIMDIDIICFNNKNRFEKRGICMPNASPKEFVELFYNASFVITNSFHGTCFSIIFGKKFICVAHPSKGIRQINLLEKAGLMNRLYNSQTPIQDYIEKDIKIKDDFLNYIESSKRFLDELQ